MVCAYVRLLRGTQFVSSGRTSIGLPRDSDHHADYWHYRARRRIVDLAAPRRQSVAGCATTLWQPDCSSI